MLSLLCSPHHWSALEPDASAERGGPDGNARTARGQRLDSTRAAPGQRGQRFGSVARDALDFTGFFSRGTLRFSEAAPVVP